MLLFLLSVVSMYIIHFKHHVNFIKSTPFSLRKD